ncbi:hypothetical protein PIB30_085808 [Stylosanthes scabra]|uniref:RNase H type-1 domain-containing protein n=1 Tax=Stylosanthes scabra TaxID=79078 RepID=A0ABU6XVB8_9FABA|nr:hypothetical protein [Stylosanthes scabra]
MGNGSMTGFGCTARDSYGVWLRGCSGSLTESVILKAELFAIWRGLLLAWDNGYREVICETDSLDAFLLSTRFDVPATADTMAKSAAFSRQNHIEWNTPCNNLVAVLQQEAPFA